MKIIITGGGTGGHFYPLIAVVEEIRSLAKEKRIIDPEIYFISVNPYNPGLLFENKIQYIQINSGKFRRNFTSHNFLRNILDVFRIIPGIFHALWKVFLIYPDVVFGKGGYSSFPTLFASIILAIPVVIHDSDSIPGKVNAFIGKFAKRIAISYPDAAKYFPKANSEGRVAWTGNPIRKEIINPKSEGAKEAYKLEDNIPVVLVLGGSQGAQLINDALVDALPNLVEFCQIIHQTGENNFEAVRGRSVVALRNSSHANRYKPYPYLNEEQIQFAYSASDLIISRAGSTIFEIAVSGKPSILIPINEVVSRDQRKNAFSYGRTGAAIVVEENNLQPEIITAEITKILKNPELQEKMKLAATAFAKKDAARTIAEAILDIGLSHE